MDKRQQKTRKSIFRAFGDLLGKTNYDSITIQDIIDEANIGRSTFYAHFNKKDELMKSFCEEVFVRIFLIDFQNEHTHDKKEKKKEFTHLVENILIHIKEEKEDFFNIFNCCNRDVFLSHFESYINHFFYNSLFEHEHNFFEPTRVSIALKILRASFIGILEYWASAGFELAPIKLAEEFVSVFDFSDSNTNSPCALN